MKKSQSPFLPFLMGFLGMLINVQPAQTQTVARDVLSAIVTVHSQVPASSRTARFLGEQRSGSGVVIDRQGHILTIGYLVMEANKIEVTGVDGRRIQATVVANDTRTGFGLLRASEPLNVTPMQFGKSADLTERTEVVIASDSSTASVRPTLVTSRREFVGYWEYLLEDAIFTAPPHPRYAGAALIGLDGKLLGIGSLLVNDALPGRESLTGNMFVPIDHLKPILKDLISQGRTKKARRPWIGLFTEEFRDKLIIMFVAPDGPAEKSGIKANDLILKVAGQPVKDQADFYRKMWAVGEAGADIPLTLLQGTEIKTIIVRSSDRGHYFRQPVTPSPPSEPLQST